MHAKRCHSGYFGYSGRFEEPVDDDEENDDDDEIKSMLIVAQVPGM